MFHSGVQLACCKTILLQSLIADADGDGRESTFPLSNSGTNKNSHHKLTSMRNHENKTLNRSKNECFQLSMI